MYGSPEIAIKTYDALLYYKNILLQQLKRKVIQDSIILFGLLSDRMYVKHSISFLII